MNKKSQSTLDKLENIMRVKAYSKNTINAYLHYTGIYLNKFDCDFYHISVSDTVKFIHEFNYTSKSQQNQIAI